MNHQREINILKLLKRLNLNVSAGIDRMFSVNELTASQCEILNYLIEHENREVVSTDIHMDLGTSRASVSMILKRLRQKGYVVFRCSPEDDRRKRIFLTERACRMKGKIDERAGEMCEYLYRGFSGQERENLEYMVRKMLQNLQKAELEQQKNDRNRRSENGNNITETGEAV